MAPVGTVEARLYAQQQSSRGVVSLCSLYSCRIVLSLVVSPLSLALGASLLSDEFATAGWLGEGRVAATTVA